MAKKTTKKKASREKPTDELKAFLERQTNYLTAVEVSKSPTSENVDERNAYFNSLQEAAKKAPEGLQRRFSQFTPKTPRPELDGFAAGLNRVYDDQAETYFEENRDKITRQIDDSRLANLVLAIEHPDEGDASRKDIIALVKDYQAVAKLNQAFDRGEIDGDEMLGIARKEASENIKGEIEAMREDPTAEGISDKTWKYLQGTYAIFDMPDTAAEARQVSGQIEEAKAQAVYEKLKDDSARAGFVRESLGYLPVDKARQLTYLAATAKAKKK